MTADLTIGMAHFQDFDGVCFTIQALRMMNPPEVMRRVELIVVDNSPGSPDSRALFNRQGSPGFDPQQGPGLLPSIGGGGAEAANLADVRYAPFTERNSTSASRQMIIDQATAPNVLVIDCHVLLDAGSIGQLIETLNKPAEGPTIYSGPIRLDSLAPDMIQTHFNDRWGGHMWGQWGTAWRCCDDGVVFTTIEDVDSVSYFDVATQVPLQTCISCGREFPTLTWNGHNTKLVELGYRQMATDRSDPPFEIPGCGLGAFAVRKADWPGFHPEHRGFGGEEMCIHESHRQLGGKAICLPFLGWWHRFSRPRGVPYPLRLWDKLRNYLLHMTELGLPLDDLHEHFVLEGEFKQSDWDQLIDDPVGMVNPPEKPGCGSCKKSKAVGDAESLDQLFAVVAKTPRDLDRHLPKLRELADQVNHITEFTKRRESTIAFLAARPKALRSYQREQDPAIVKATAWAMAEGVDVTVSSKLVSKLEEIEPTELLFIDDEHTAAAVSKQLKLFADSVSRYIVLHDTSIHAEKGSDGGPGLLVALREFMREHPVWSVVYHTVDQYGLTVIGCRIEDKPKRPSVFKMAANLAKAMAEYAADGLQKVTAEQLEGRLETCSSCDQRVGTRCSACGCALHQKAAIRVSACPLGYWSEEEQVSE